MHCHDGICTACVHDQANTVEIQDTFHTRVKFAADMRALHLV